MYRKFLKETMASVKEAERVNRLYLGMGFLAGGMLIMLVNWLVN